MCLVFRNCVFYHHHHHHHHRHRHVKHNTQATRVIRTRLCSVLGPSHSTFEQICWTLHIAIKSQSMLRLFSYSSWVDSHYLLLVFNFLPLILDSWLSWTAFITSFSWLCDDEYFWSGLDRQGSKFTKNTLNLQSRPIDWYLKRRVSHNCMVHAFDTCFPI